MKSFLRAVLLTALAVNVLPATNFSFTGTFTTDDQVQLFYVNLGTTSAVTFETLSYGGGTNSEGTVILPGGFNPRLTWFQADGTQIGADNGGHCGFTNIYLGACNDAFFEGSLDAGSYILALTQDGNYSNGDLSAGFGQQGNPQFTASGFCTAFCDSLTGTSLTGNWAVDILNVDSASAVPDSASTVPEPVSVILTGCGLSLLALARGRRTDQKN
jgi:hypothetical protein